MDKNEISRGEITKAYRNPLCTLSTYLFHLASFELQVLQGGDISKYMRVCGARHGDMENKLFGGFCHARKNSIAVDG